MQKNSGLKILFVSAEVSPFAKTGGLADVAGSLPQALASMGNDIRVVMPQYKIIKNPMEYVTDFPVMVDFKKETCIVKGTEVPIGPRKQSGSMPVYFIGNYHYYDREGIYCYPDDGERFAFFCSAVLGMLPKINFKPDIIHCNDWHTGPICMILKENYKDDPFYSGISTVYTVHNLEYQGNFWAEAYKLFNVGRGVLDPDKAEFYGEFSFMKAGLAYCDKISTVSEAYAREIQTPEYGEKLEGLLQKRESDLSGIINGISYNDFNPQKDKIIYRNFNAKTAHNKRENKYALQRELGLPVGDMPVAGLISRLTGQKGLDLIIESLDEMMAGQDMQFILLGSGDANYEEAFKNAAIKYPDKISAYIGFNVELAQKIYAGCDIFLMPSRFEPCGLGQMISLRYGAVPVVRAVGGLADTVIDFDADNENGNGFSFTGFTAKALQGALNRALKLYREEPAVWYKLIEKGMGCNFSWSTPAKKYMKLYQTALKDED